MFVLANVLVGLAKVLDMVLWLYWWILLGRAVTSWVSADPRNPIVSFLYAVTEPPMRLIRRRLPTSLRYFPLDVAFLVLLGLIVFAQYAIVPSILEYAMVLRGRSGPVVIG
ncbi:MAG: YggT family protein [Vicinamibacteria bacterium]